MQDLIGYDEIIENSMRLVISETLKKVEKTGLLGKHYFVITFLTGFKGISVPKKVLEKYHDEMTIVIQHQFKNLLVEDECFKISLSFNGRYEKLTIPYRAITSFADPSMNFVLRFSMAYGEVEGLIGDEYDAPELANRNDSKKGGADVDLSAKVISLDAFRKNRDNTNS